MTTTKTTPVAFSHTPDPTGHTETHHQEPPMEMEIDVAPSCAPLGVTDMPTEILMAIAERLAPLSAYALITWSTVIGIDLPRGLLCASIDASVERMAISVLTQPVQRDDRRLVKARADAHREIVAAGAPLVVVDHLLSNKILCLENVIDAATGGRTDVFDWAWERACANSYVWYGDEGCNRGRHAADAMVRAVRRDRRAVVRWMLERAIRDYAQPFTSAAHHEILVYALERGYGDVLDAVHRLQRKVAHRQRCWCPSSLKKGILREGRTDMLALLKNADCDLIHGLDYRDLDKVVCKGHTETARWIAAHLADPVVSDYAVSTAAGCGHLATLSFVHDAGLGTCTAAHIDYALRNGHVHVARWASGEGDARPTRPIDFRCTPQLVYQAVAHGHADVLAWMVPRVGMAPATATGIARFSVASGHWRCALVLHRCGLAPLDTWDALAVAVRHCDIEGIAALADAGARCGPAVLAAALLQPDAHLIAFLCGRFGVGYLQVAVDSVIGLPFVHDPLAWVAANVPAVCVAQAAHQQSADPRVWAGWRFCCACVCCQKGTKAQTPSTC